MTKRRITLLTAEGLFELKKKPIDGVCLVKWCCEKGHARKTGLCHKHFQARWRMKNPKRSAYAALRDHAKGRGIAFSLTFDYFEGMLDGLRFWDHEAESRGDALSLDRIDPTKGYVRGNIRVITLSENVIEGNKIRHLPEYVQHIIERKRAKAKEAVGFKEIDPDACPF